MIMHSKKTKTKRQTAEILHLFYKLTEEKKPCVHYN